MTPKQAIIMQLNDMWWDGYDTVCDEVYSQHGIELTPAECKKHLQNMRKLGYVETQPIFTHEGKLNGSGWFITEEGEYWRDKVE